MELALYHRLRHNTSIPEKNSMDLKMNLGIQIESFIFNVLPRRYRPFMKFLEKSLGHI
jgi:hypothetical protein